MDVWDQVHLYALWNEQTGNSELLKPPLVRKDRRFFDGEIIMNNYLYDRGFKILLPHWETIQKELKTDDECQEPHFHVRDIYTETDTAICLQSNKYCKHQNKETHTFIYDFGELLLAFMKEPCRSPRYADNYEFAVSMWNINNQSECSWQKDEGGCSIIPDYRSMNTRIAKKNAFKTTRIATICKLMKT